MFRRWVFFLFATDLAKEMGVTDDWYTDGRVPSVIISLTDFIPVVITQFWVIPQNSLFFSKIKKNQNQKNKIKADNAEKADQERLQK
jgi:hypothetical protein